MVRTQVNQPLTVLFVAANPTSTPLMLAEEIREITQKVRQAEHRDLLRIEQIWAARPDDVLQALNEHKPHIVHFSSHGSPNGEIILTGSDRKPKPVNAATLQSLFAVVKDNVRIVVLNACYSRIQARAITTVIDCAIGIDTAISNRGALAFSASFYRALCFDRSVLEAFQQAKVAMQLEGASEADRVQLLLRSGVAPSRMFCRTLGKAAAQGNHQQRLDEIVAAIKRQHYSLAFQFIDSTLKSSADTLTEHERAALKYYEALVHLEGHRPFVSTSPQVLRMVETLMYAACELHNLSSYKKFLAICKFDIAKAGLVRHKEEATRLLKEAQKLPFRSEDKANIALLAACQPTLYHEYRRYLS